MSDVRVDARAREDEPLRHTITPRPKRLFGRCAFCGARTYGRACPCHRDLIQLDRTQSGTG